MQLCSHKQIGTDRVDVRTTRIDVLDERPKRLDMALSGVEKPNRRHLPSIAEDIWSRLDNDRDTAGSESARELALEAPRCSLHYSHRP